MAPPNPALGALNVGSQSCSPSTYNHFPSSFKNRLFSTNVCTWNPCARDPCCFLHERDARREA